MGKVYTINELEHIISPIAEKHNVSRVYLFGSYARGEADEKSDIDLRVDAEHLKTLVALGGLYADLEEALGKSLDLVTTEALRKKKEDPLTRRFIKNIRKDEKLLYEKITADSEDFPTARQTHE